MEHAYGIFDSMIIAKAELQSGIIIQKLGWI